jgi:hypothetical protein
MSNLLKVMDQDKRESEPGFLSVERDADKEEEYDYFLDAHKDENMNDNKGYHIIDQADLDSMRKEKKTEEVDEDDLD